jgi:tripartite-type tricarboxylate transporter receptor subunit TctC
MYSVFAKHAAAMTILCALAAATPSAAQTYPSRPIKVIMAGGPGGAGDTVMRVIGEHLKPRLGGQPILIENRPGAGGNLAASAVARAEPDGHTLHMAASSIAVAPSIYKKLTYDPVRDFAPIAFVGTIPMVLVANRNFPARTLPEMIALARAKPGEIWQARTTQGTPGHLGFELLKQQADITMRVVPYRNNPQAMIDLLAGHVSVFLDFVTNGAGFVRSGQVHALATTGNARSLALPEVPTAMESGLPNLEVSTWFGFFAPARTPPHIVAKLHAEVMAVLAIPAARASLNALGVEIAAGGPKEMEAYLAAEIAKYRDIIAKAGIEQVE